MLNILHWAHNKKKKKKEISTLCTHTVRADTTFAKKAAGEEKIKKNERTIFLLYFFLLLSFLMSRDLRSLPQVLYTCTKHNGVSYTYVGIIKREKKEEDSEEEEKLAEAEQLVARILSRRLHLYLSPLRRSFFRARALTHTQQYCTENFLLLSYPRWNFCTRDSSSCGSEQKKRENRMKNTRKRRSIRRIKRLSW